MTSATVEVFIDAASQQLEPMAAVRTAAVQDRLQRVLAAFSAERVGPQHFASVTGYGHGDQGREVADQ